MITHTLEEDFENTTCFFVDETRDTFHATTTSETPNSLARRTVSIPNLRR